jgi:hypothetical protein
MGSVRREPKSLGQSVMSDTYNQGRSVMQAGGGNEYYEEVSENENDNVETLEEMLNKKI